MGNDTTFTAVLSVGRSVLVASNCWSVNKWLQLAHPGMCTSYPQVAWSKTFVQKGGEPNKNGQDGSDEWNW